MELVRTCLALLTIFLGHSNDFECESECGVDDNGVDGNEVDMEYLPERKNNKMSQQASFLMDSMGTEIVVDEKFKLKYNSNKGELDEQ